MSDLRRRPFRLPEGVDRVISVRPRWVGAQGDLASSYVVVRVWYDGRVEDVYGPVHFAEALRRAREAAAVERTVYLRAPDDATATSAAPLFGAVPGIRPGQIFHRRIDLKKAGLVRNLQQGIDYCAGGALAIVFAGGYVDDEWSDDPWYTGEGGQDAPGGRQVLDQEMVRGNRALMRNLREGLPVRVVRKVVRPDGDYDFTYEGLFYVVDHMYSPGRDGPKVYRFKLRRV